MTEYTIPLALEDFLPVILSSIGLWLIGRMIGRKDPALGQMATIGWALITLGGLLKATWKLTMALTRSQTDIVWMDKGMFAWMAAGFTLMACAVWLFSEKGEVTNRASRIWLAPAIVLAFTLVAILFTGFPDVTINTWRFVLLGVMTIGNVVLVVVLIQMARRRQLNRAALLFLLNIVVVFILSGLARIPEQTIPLQWTEQLLNTFAQGAFAFAAWKVAQALSAEGRTRLW